MTTQTELYFFFHYLANANKFKYICDSLFELATSVSSELGTNLSLLRLFMVTSKKQLRMNDSDAASWLLVRKSCRAQLTS